MSKLTRFSPPAHQAVHDFGGDTDGLKQYWINWNNNVTGWTLQSITGNPWSNANDDDRYYYFDPLTTDVPDNAKVIPITWTPFPNRLFNFFQDPAAPKDEQFSDEQIFELADMGEIEVNGKMTPINELQVPAQLCPENDWKGILKGYDPDGPRGWLDEYCEWSVKRDENGKLRQVMFTCENPAYWFTMWRQDPQLVCKLYQKYVNPNVQLKDLCLLDRNGSPVFDPLTGHYAYNPTNKWNSGTKTLPDSGGAIHLTSPPNTLSAEIYLAAAATIARKSGNSDPQTLICCAQYGRPRRNSDPHIGQLANQVATRGMFVTLTDPVGLYIQTPNFNLWEVQGNNDDPSTFWEVTRGSADPNNPGQGFDSILHAVFTVPDELEPEDILINGKPLQWAGQITTTFEIALRVTGMPATQTNPNEPVPQQPRDCVQALSASDPHLQPWPVQFLPYDMFLASSPIPLWPYAPQGTTTKMVLVVQGGLKDAKIEFDPPDGISPVSVSQYIPNASGAPGQTSGGDTQAYVFDLTVASDAPIGTRSVRVTNLKKTVPAGGLPWEPGVLQIVPATS